MFIPNEIAVNLCKRRCCFVYRFENDMKLLSANSSKALVSKISLFGNFFFHDLWHSVISLHLVKQQC